MQGNNDLKNQYLMIPISLDDIIEAGIDISRVIQTSAAEGRIIIKNVDESEDFIYDEDNLYDEDNPCDGECENCPFFEPNCDEDCENCPCCCPECGECMCDAVNIEGEKEDE